MPIVDGSPERVGMSAHRLGRIDEVMRAYVERRGYAGIAVAIARRGETVFRGEYGVRDKEAELPMTDDTIVRIYSMTKPIACVAVMSLVEEAKLRLTDPVSTYLPAFGSLRVMTDDGTLTDLRRPVTLHDLLTHTSGLTNEVQATRASASYREARVHYDATRSLEAFVDEVGRLPLAFQPGERWHYSAGVDVAARVAEVVTGQPFGRLLEERVFAPLGMVDTAFGVPDDKVDRLAAMYGLPDIFGIGVNGATIVHAMTAGVNERIDVSDTHPVDRPDVFVRGGFGLYSTLNDYLRFAQLLANRGELGGARVLGTKTVELMYMNHLPTALLPFAPAGVEEPGWGFGLGSRVLLDVASTGVLGSNGEHRWPGAANTYYWVDPTEELVGVLMTQYMLGFAGPEQDLHTLAYHAVVD
jgi:CubicO group peptidase (beta-lactamase class C family)